MGTKKVWFYIVGATVAGLLVMEPGELVAVFLQLGALFVVIRELGRGR